jgi:hypothetical protein
MQAFSPATARVYSNGQMDFLRLYALLTPAQRQVNAERARVGVNQMSGQQKAILEKIVYKFNGPMIMGRGTMAITAIRSDRTPGEERPEPQIIQQEPTEAFPNGLPPDTILNLRRQWADGVFAIDANSQGRFLSAADLGLRQGIDTSQFPPGTFPQTQFTKYQLADLVYVSLNLTFGRRNRSGDLRDASIRTGAAELAYEKLPKGFLDSVDKARQQAANMKTMSIGRGGSAVPPPP